MRQSNTRTVAEQKPLGVIDAVSAGLDLVRRRPWTLLIPILIDVMIWVLPRLSLTQLFRPYVEEMLTVAAQSGDPETVEQARQMVQELTGTLNLFGLVTTALNSVTHLPSLFRLDKYPSGVVNVTSPVSAWAFTQQLAAPELMVVLFVPMFLLGLLLAAIYLEWIAQGVRPLETPAPGAALVRIARLWLRLMGYALVLFGVALSGTLMMGLVQSIVPSPELAGFFTLLFMVGLFWLTIYFYFVIAAMAVGGVNVLVAIRRSVLLFRIFFWSTIGLVVLSVFLNRGLAIVWDGLAVTSFGVVIAIAANAYIGTSLIAAAMVYYQDRMNLLERWRQTTRSAKK